MVWYVDWAFNMRSLYGRIIWYQSGDIEKWITPSCFCLCDDAGI